MHRAALEGVVEILAVRRRAVDERRTGRAQRARVADGGAGPVLIPAVQCGLDVVLVAGGQAKPDHVDQQFLAARAHRRRQLAGVERGNPAGQMFGDGHFGQSCGHGHAYLYHGAPRCRVTDGKYRHRFLRDGG